MARYKTGNIVDCYNWSHKYKECTGKIVKKVHFAAPEYYVGYIVRYRSIVDGKLKEHPYRISQIRLHKK